MRFLKLLTIALIFTSCQVEDATIEENYGYPLRFGIEPTDTITGRWESRLISSIEKFGFNEHCARFGIPKERLIQGHFNSLIIYPGAGDVYSHSDLNIFDSLQLYLSPPYQSSIYLGSIHKPFTKGTNHWEIEEKDLLEHVLEDHDEYTLKWYKNSVPDSIMVFTIGMNYHLKTD